jgi:class 3 adenylate cyclase/tetratricopeptide (TPR) repeat protein
VATTTVTCSACGAETSAGKKFCAECGSRLQAVCPACGASVIADQKFCAECGSALAGAAAVRSPVDEERRLVTAVFCDLVGFTPLSERLDADEVREILAAYFAAMAGEVSRYGGVVDKYAGDAVLAVFGVPIAHEDDAERAVLCSLAMQQAIRPVAEEVERLFGVPLAIRVGVNTGEAVSGSWDASGQESAVTGDAINVAARLETAAEPGDVVVGAETMRLARRRIRFGEGAELVLKGKSEPVTAYVALGVRDDTGADTTRPAAPLIGRERELDLLADAWASARAGEGQLVTIIGDPGVGKSRLVAEALSQLQPEGATTHSLRARCLSYGQSISLWLIADLLRSLCALPEDAHARENRERIDARVEELLGGNDDADRAIARDVLGEILGLPAGGSLVTQADPQVRRSSLVRVLGLLLASLAASEPLLLVVEDLHWLDSASNEILEALLSEVPGRRILVLATQRPGWTASWSGWSWTERLVLRPLAAEEAAALAGAVLGGGRLSTVLEQHLRERAEGNPFFVEELILYLQESGGLEESGGEIRVLPDAAERLPATLTELLLARLDRLEGRVRAVAQVGSVIGRSFAVRLLARVMDREEALLSEPLRALQQAEIAFPHGGGDPEYVFKHVTLRDVAYGMLVQRRRRELHLAAARAIADLYPTDEYVEMVAYHLARSDEHAEAAEWLERAGNRARDAFANETAITHYEAALERLERSEVDETKRIELVLRCAQLEDVRGNYERARALYREVGEKTGDFRAVLGEAEVLRKLGAYDDCLAIIRGVRSTRPGLTPSETGALALVEGWVLALIGENQRGIDTLEQGLQDVAGRDHELEGRLLLQLARAKQMFEMHADALADAERARGLFEARDDLLNLATALRVLGGIQHELREDDARARATLEEALVIARRVGSAEETGASLINLGQVLSEIGDTTAALAADHEALAAFTTVGLKAGIACAYCNIGEHLIVLGRWEEAREAAAAGLTVSEETNNPYWSTGAQIALSTAELALGNAGRAATLAEDAAERAVAAGYEARARAAFDVAARAHEQIGNAERAAEIRHRAGQA